MSIVGREALALELVGAGWGEDAPQHGGAGHTEFLQGSVHWGCRSSDWHDVIAAPLPGPPGDAAATLCSH